MPNPFEKPSKKEKFFKILKVIFFTKLPMNLLIILVIITLSIASFEYIKPNSLESPTGQVTLEQECPEYQPEEQECETDCDLCPIKTKVETKETIKYQCPDNSIVENLDDLLRTRSINFCIRHTARTWGADIEALLSGHINNILVPPPKLREFAWKNSGKIGLAVGITFFAAALFFSFWTASQLWNYQKLQISDYLGDAVQLPLKMDFVLQTISSGIWAKYYFSVIVFLIICVALSIILGIWVENSADTNKPSFIILTEQSERNKRKRLKKYQNKLVSFILSLVLSFVTGVLANYLFQYFWKAP